MQAYPDGINDHYWNYARYKIIESKMRKNFSRDFILLDVGCGRGGEVSLLRKDGWKCWGCDVSSCVPISKDLASFIFYNSSSLELDPAFRKSVSALLFLDVLEHIAEPQQFILEHIRKYENLKKILLTVPARQELWTNYDVYYGHHKRYNFRVLNDLLGGIMHIQKEAGYLFHSLYVPARITSFLGKKRKIEITAPLKEKIPWHRLASYCFILEEKVIPSFIPGTSLYSIITLSR